MGREQDPYDRWTLINCTETFKMTWPKNAA